MSATPPPVPPDDPLGRAERVLRRLPGPDGPCAETMARTLAALRSLDRANTPVKTRRNVMHFIMNAAAALLAAAGLWYAGGVVTSESPLAFAAVAEKLADAHTLAYRVEMQLPGVKEPATMRYLFKDPGLLRAETPGGPVSVMDIKTNRTLVLDTKKKSAVLVAGKAPGEPQGGGKDGALQVLDRLRRLAKEKGQPAGKQRIGGVEAQGFRVPSDGPEMTIWADPKSGQPLKAEMTVRVDKQDVRYTLSDFEIDPALDAALFGLEPPEGYQLQKLDMAATTPEEDVAQFLGTYAKLSGGTFPAKLDDWSAFDQQLKKKKFGGPADPEYVALVQLTVRVVMFTLQHKGGYGYQADGVKLGDADKVLFWYRPERAEKYRAVFGDLHTGEVAADRLPKR